MNCLLYCCASEYDKQHAQDEQLRDYSCRGVVNKVKLQFCACAWNSFHPNGVK